MIILNMRRYIGIKTLSIISIFQVVNYAVFAASSCVGDSLECRSDHVAKEEYQDGGASRRAAAFLAESLEVYAPVSTAVENELCRKHGLFFQDGVRNNEMWALRMLDASSKLPSGILAGNVVHLGNYDECLSVEDVASEFGRFSGQHCMVSIGERSFATELHLVSKAQLLEKYLDSDLTHMKSGGELFSALSMMWSVCVPSSCGPRDVERHLRSALRTRLGNVSISVHDGACSSRAFKAPLTPIQWRYIAFIGVIGVLCLFSTAYDVVSSDSGPQKKLLLAFSLKLHIHRLLQVDRSSEDSLPVVNGLHAMNLFLVFLTHQIMIIALEPAVNTEVFREYRANAGWFDTFMFNPSLAVDSLFLISGLLVSFDYLNHKVKGDTMSLPLYYIRRYIKQTPLLIGTQMIGGIYFTIDWIRKRPFMNHYFTGKTENCEDWFHTLLHITNYQEFNKLCFGHSWYLAVEMQLFFLSPIILYPMWRWPSLGKKLLSIFTVLGLVISCGTVYVNDLRPNLDIVAGEHGSKLFLPTQTRFTPWLIGIGLGYALHSTKRATPLLSRSVVASCWLVSGALMTASLGLMKYFLSPGYVYNLLSFPLYLGLMRPAWSLGLAWFVFATSRGYGGFLTSLFSNHVFDIMSRLSYSFYLVHFAVIFAFTEMKAPVYLSMVTIISRFTATLLFSLGASVVFHLLFEAPPIYIERSLRSKPKNN